MFEKFPKIYNVYFLAIVATMGGMLFGFDISSMSAIIPSNQYLDYFDNPSGVVQGAIGSALAAGSVVGSAMAGPISDKFGRRDALVFACLWWLVGTAVQVACTGRGMLIAGRVLNGVTVGITSSQVPVYLAEISKHSQRGAIIIIQQLAIEWGILIMSTAQKKRSVILVRPFRADGNIEDPYVIAEYEEIVTALTAERLAPRGWRKFVVNGMWKRTLAGFSVQAWQQLSGANVMTYYVVYIFAMAGLQGNTKLISSGVQYALFIIFSSIMFFFVDKIGRRTLLVWGAITMAFCHFVVGGVSGAHYTYVPDGVGGDTKNVVSGGYRVTRVHCHCVLIPIYALTLAPICWVYAAEVWSLETRASGMGIAAIGNWLFNFAIGLFIPPAFINIKWGLFVVFGVLCVLASIQFFFTYPETCGKTLEEIEVLFSKEGPHAWQTKKGSSHLAQDVENVAAAQAKGDALATIENIAKKEKDETQTTEAV
ncbi:unnamed protein product [Alternaria alternata]